MKSVVRYTPILRSCPVAGELEGALAYFAKHCLRQTIITPNSPVLYSATSSEPA
jgi:hypothetical protein